MKIWVKIIAVFVVFLVVISLQAEDKIFSAKEEDESAVPEMMKSDIETFLEKVIKASAEENERTMKALEDYSFREKEIQYGNDKKGNRKIVGTSTTWYYYSRKYQAFRTVPEMIDGEEVSEKAQKKHQKKEEKLLRKRLERKEKEKLKEKKKGKEEKDSSAVQVELGWTKLSGEDIVKLFEFSYDGDDKIENTPVHLISFKRREKTELDKEDISKQVPAVSGKLWITEDKYNVVKVEFSLDKKYKPLWMLSVRKLYMLVNYLQVDNKYWFPSDITAMVDAKLFKIKGYNYSGKISRSDFVRYTVTVGEERENPKQ